MSEYDDHEAQFSEARKRLEESAQLREAYLEVLVHVQCFREFVRDHDSHRVWLSDEEEAVLVQAEEIIKRITDRFTEAAVEWYDEEQEGGTA